MNEKQMHKAIRLAFRDVAYPYRMPAGIPGDVNRTHPASIEPVINSVNNPALFYGEAVIVDGVTNTVRPFGAADDAVDTLYGVTVRPYPTQQPASANFGSPASFGGGAPVAGKVMDVLRSGYIMASVVGQTVKGGTVYVWIAASGGGHTQGGFEAADGAGNTATLNPKVYQFNGPPDANGNVEIAINV